MLPSEFITQIYSLSIFNAAQWQLVADIHQGCSFNCFCSFVRGLVTRMEKCVAGLLIRLHGVNQIFVFICHLQVLKQSQLFHQRVYRLKAELIKPLAHHETTRNILGIQLQITTNTARSEEHTSE